MTQTAPTRRTQVNRLPKRGDYSKEAIHSILNAAFLCHVGFVMEGQPYVIPTGYGRDGDTLYIHGSAASRMLRNLEKGIEACVTVTLADPLSGTMSLSVAVTVIVCVPEGRKQHAL